MNDSIQSPKHFVASSSGRISRTLVSMTSTPNYHHISTAIAGKQCHSTEANLLPPTTSKNVEDVFNDAGKHDTRVEVNFIYWD